MRPNLILRTLLAIAVFVAASPFLSARGKNLVSYVDPYIGTGGHGHVFLGANVPFGLVQLGPVQPIEGWDWCSGYNYAGTRLSGFSHTRLSGTGVGDLGDLQVMPVADPDQRTAPFSHADEQVRPGYYSVRLAHPAVRVELTATQRVGFHRYTYDTDSDTLLLTLDLRQGVNEGIDDARMTDCLLTSESPTRLTGLRRTSGWAKDRRVYFDMEFSRPVTILRRDSFARAVLAVAGDGQPLLVKVALSAVDIDHAKQNMQAELPGWDFDAATLRASDAWEQQLSRITVSGADDRTLRIFYTSLFHTMTAPSVFSDVDGCYRGADGEVHRADHTVYTTFSLWDTYRAAHPLLTLIQPGMQGDFVRTFMDIYREQGKLPVWHLWGNETDCMVGSPCVPVLGDLVLKGFCRGQEDEAYAAMRASMMRSDRSLDVLRTYGYIPFDRDTTGCTVSKALEYCLADDAVARVATLVGKTDDADYFRLRSQSYRKYFDTATRLMRAVSADGQFRRPFNPFYAGYDDNDYTEGNAWQYTFLVPHDVHGLISLFGGERPFVAKLDSLFTTDTPEGTELAPDVTGFVGQYAQGNEPSHHAIYLYHYAGQPWKAFPRLRQMLQEQYLDLPDGLSGNEDVGQMSAWYVLSSVGLYQVHPSTGRYLIGSPLFAKATLNVGQGRTFTVKTVGADAGHIYIQKATLNGRPYTRSYIDYADIARGGELVLSMGAKPSRWGTAKADRP